MKGVKLEDVTGEKAPKPQAIHKPAAAGETGMIGRPKTLEEQMDAAAGQAAWAIVACYFTAVLLVLVALNGIFRGDPVIIVVTAPLFAALMACCAWFMTKRSKTAAIIAISVMALLGLGYLVNAFVLTGTVSIFKAIKFGLVFAATANGVSGIFTYDRLAEQVKTKTRSDDLTKDVFGDGDTAVKESA